MSSGALLGLGIASILLLVTSCGQRANEARATPAPWNSTRLAAAILPGSAFPAGFPVLPDSQADGGAYDLKRAQAIMPTSPLSQAVARDGFVAGYQRNWLNSSDSTPAAGWISLFAFRDNAGAEHFAAQSRAFFSTVGVSVAVVPDIAGGATAYTAHGPRGTSYAVEAVRDGVIVEVAAGGAEITLVQVNQLAKEQLARV